MTKKILVIGCGNIGSRHLQSLMMLPFETKIEIVEPNENAQLLAKEGLKEIKHSKSYDSISWYESLDQIQNKSDLTVIATQSPGRSNLINQLLDLGHRRFLIEKIVCQSVDEYDLLLSTMKKYNAKGWVNTNRRYFYSYKKIKELFKNNKLSITVTGAYPRLGTSAIHYIDLLCWLSEDYEIKLDGEFLADELFPNKRGSNFKEFAGTITGSLKNNSTLTITFLPKSNVPSIITLVSNNNHIIIDETNEKITNQTNSIKDHLEFKFQHTSEITKLVAQDILYQDDCLLPTLEDLYIPHCELFKIFNNHIKKLTNEDIRLCPIT